MATRATDSASRVVVDEYIADGKGGFKLSTMANDLFSYLHRCDISISVALTWV